MKKLLFILFFCLVIQINDHAQSSLNDSLKPGKITFAYGSFSFLPYNKKIMQNGKLNFDLDVVTNIYLKNRAYLNVGIACQQFNYQRIGFTSGTISRSDSFAVSSSNFGLIFGYSKWKQFRRLSYGTSFNITYYYCDMTIKNLTADKVFSVKIGKGPGGSYATVYPNESRPLHHSWALSFSVPLCYTVTKRISIGINNKFSGYVNFSGKNEDIYMNFDGCPHRNNASILSFAFYQPSLILLIKF